MRKFKEAARITSHNKEKLMNNIQMFPIYRNLIELKV